MRAAVYEFRAVGVFPLEYGARRLNRHELHAQVNAQIGDVVLARIPYGAQQTQESALTVVSGNDDTVYVCKIRTDVINMLKRFRIDLFDRKISLERGDGRVEQRFTH